MPAHKCVPCACTYSTPCGCVSCVWLCGRCCGAPVAAGLLPVGRCLRPCSRWRLVRPPVVCVCLDPLCVRALLRCMPRLLSPALELVYVPRLLGLVLLSFLFVLPAHSLPKVPVCALRLYLQYPPCGCVSCVCLCGRCCGAPVAAGLLPVGRCLRPCSRWRLVRPPVVCVCLDPLCVRALDVL